MNICGYKRKFEAIVSPADTTSQLSPCTPAQWLQTVICSLPAKPSAELERFMSSCDGNVTDKVICRASIILGAIFPRGYNGNRCMSSGLHNSSLMNSGWIEQRQEEALKLYYKVLESICESEAQKLQGRNLTQLLTNERFHRCMLVCSAELVSAAHMGARMLFPAVLERIGITAFDLSRVTESFIKHEGSLPRELKRYLNSMEEQMLESMVWGKGSSLYNSLIVARPSLAEEIRRLGLLAKPMPSLDAIAADNLLSYGGLPHPPGQNGNARSSEKASSELHNSSALPMKEHSPVLNDQKPRKPPPSPPLLSAFASPTQPNPGGRGSTCLDTGINLLFEKVAKLAAVRINHLTLRLKPLQPIREIVYGLFHRILNQKTALCFNRHVDQIILCCFYIIVKDSKLELTFKEIKDSYVKQPQHGPQVVSHVFVNRSPAHANGKNREDHIDIVAFYKEIFLSAVKPLLVEVKPAKVSDQAPDQAANNADDECPGSPRISPFPSIPDLSPKKVSPSHNVYLSPLQPSKKEALISTGAKSYYAYFGESTRAYQSPSKDLTTINNCLRSRPKLRRRLDVEFVSHSEVARALFHHQSA